MGCHVEFLFCEIVLVWQSPPFQRKGELVAMNSVFSLVCMSWSIYVRTLVKSAYQKKISYFSTETIVVCTQKTVSMRRFFEHPKYMFKLMD